MDVPVLDLASSENVVEGEPGREQQRQGYQGVNGELVLAEGLDALHPD